jgi:hypothetical protein
MISHGPKRRIHTLQPLMVKFRRSPAGGVTSPLIAPSLVSVSFAAPSIQFSSLHRDVAFGAPLAALLMRSWPAFSRWPAA